jgi:hypothetical protein
MIKRLLLASVLLLPMVISPGEARTLRGAGATSCGTWLADRAEPGGRGHMPMLSWALGFLSVVYSDEDMFDPLKNADSDAVLYWLDNQCRSNPTQRFSEALITFTFQQANQNLVRR